MGTRQRLKFSRLLCVRTGSQIGRSQAACQGRAVELGGGSAGERDPREQSPWAVARGRGIAPAPAAGCWVAGPAGDGRKAQADTSVVGGWGGWATAE